MLKKALLDTDVKFLRELAMAIKQPTEPIRVCAQDTYMDQDTATQSAQAYWMLGWTWEEIEMILEQQGHAEKEIAKAIKETKEYAKQIHTEGPFAPLKSGQLVKLQNGAIVNLQSISAESCQVKQGQETFTIDASKINMKASKILSRAFALRQSAKKIVEIAQKELSPPESYEEVDVSPDIPETFQTLYREKSAPPGWGELAPEIGEVEPINKMLGKIINNLDGLKAMRDELKAKMNEMRKQLQPLSQQIKDLSREEQDELKQLFLVVSEINEGLDSMDSVIFGEYEGKIVGFRQKIIEEKVPPGVLDELKALKDIIEQNHPRVAKRVFAALEDYMDAYSGIERRTEKTFAKFPFREKPRKSHKTDAQVLTKVKEFFKGLWEKVKKATTDLYNKAFPAAENITTAIDNFSGKFSKESSRIRITAALEVLKRG